MPNERRLQRKARGARPWFFDDPSVDKVVAMVMGLAGETAVLHDRLDTIERLLEARGLLTRDDIEGYRPGDDVLAERAAWREAFLGEVLRIVESELEADASEQPYDAAIAAVEQDRQDED